MIFKVLTLFPDVFTPYLSSSIIGRGIQERRVEVELVNFRDFSKNKHRKVDDSPYGGGAGMILQCQPIDDAIQHVLTEKSKVIFFTPQGSLFNQDKAKALSLEEDLILVCGHYEDFDHRLYDLYPHEKLSIGDYILTGGELPALVLMDAVIRLNHEVLSNPESLSEESLTNGLLEYSQYTRPVDYKGLSVPDKLLSGHHKEIERWRRMSSLINTLKARPELIENVSINEEEQNYISSYLQEYQNDNQ